MKRPDALRGAATSPAIVHRTRKERGALAILVSSSLLSTVMVLCLPSSCAVNTARYCKYKCSQPDVHGNRPVPVQPFSSALEVGARNGPTHVGVFQVGSPAPLYGHSAAWSYSSGHADEPYRAAARRFVRRRAKAPREEIPAAHCADLGPRPSARPPSSSLFLPAEVIASEPNLPFSVFLLAVCMLMIAR